jgi:hypothetical protein
MSALAKATPFALRSLPSPEEWRSRKVALISGEFLPFWAGKQAD